MPRSRLHRPGPRAALSVAVVSFALWLLPGIAQAQRLGEDDIKRVTVLELTTRNVARSLIEDFLGALADGVNAVAGFEAVTRETIVGGLGELGDDIIAACDTVDCLVGVSRSHNASYLMVTNLERTVDGFDISLQLVDITEGLRVVRRESFAWGGEREGLSRVLRPYIHKLLLGEDAPPAFGWIEIAAQPDGARVLIDKEIKGKTPLGFKLRLPIGQYQLRLERDGFLAKEQPVVVTMDETTRVEITLDPAPESDDEPWYKKWWVWTAAGAVVVGATVVGLTAGLGGSESGAVEVKGNVP